MYTTEYNVLLIDDDKFFIDIFLHPIVASLTNKIMNTEKKLKNITLAYDSTEGWEKYQIIKPDIVFTDYNMPIMNGKELIEKIGKHTHKPKAIFLMSNDFITNIKEITKFIHKKDIIDSFFQMKKEALKNYSNGDIQNIS